MIFQLFLNLDELVTVRVALDQRAEWAEKEALNMRTRDGYHYFDREARISRRIARQLGKAHPVDFD